MEGVAKAHEMEYGVKPELVCEVPQVCTIIGAFADLLQGYSLMGITDKGMRIAISRRDDNAIRIFNVTKADKKKFLLSTLKYRKEDRWANAVKAIVQALSMAGVTFTGLDITIKGQSASGDPPSFAAAIFSGLSFAINQLYSLSFDQNELARISFSANRFCTAYQARLRDIITIFTVKNDKFVFFDLDTYNYTFFDYPFHGEKSDVQTYVIDCALPMAVLSASIEEFCRDGQAIVNKLKTLLPKGIKLRNYKDRDLRMLTSTMSEMERNYAGFLVQESNLAKRCYDAMINKDSSEVGKIISTQERNFMELAELTSPETDWIFKRISGDSHLLGMSQISVGISGTMLLICDSSYDIASNAVNLEEYEHIFGFHPLVRPYASSLGLRVIKTNEYPAD